jgi:hypothetical protein
MAPGLADVLLVDYGGPRATMDKPSRRKLVGIMDVRRSRSRGCFEGRRWMGGGHRPRRAGVGREFCMGEGICGTGRGIGRCLPGAYALESLTVLT